MLRAVSDTQRSTQNAAPRPAFDNHSLRSAGSGTTFQLVRHRVSLGAATQNFSNRGATATVEGEGDVRIPTWAIGVFSGTLVGALAIVGGLIAVIYSTVAGDIQDLKTDAKETRSSVQLMSASVARISEQAAVTNTRLDATNEKLQTLIDETRKRR